MVYTQANKAAQTYGKMAVSTAIEEASPHRLVQLLMAGAIEKMAVARGYMEQQNTSGKGENISWAISIIESMRASLDRDNGGEIATNLNDLYEYMSQRLLEANINNDLKAVDEVSTLMHTIHDAWIGIAGEVNASSR
ncbi:MAG: flagellar export chaperone FliS [Chromatiales bacterium]|nr:flagellar export chaperone FliS [Chromatiales bacterium]